MLCDGPELTTPTFSFDLPKHGVLHCMPTTGFLIHCQARRLSPEKLKSAKEEFDTLLNWASLDAQTVLSPRHFMSLLNLGEVGVLVETTAG